MRASRSDDDAGDVGAGDATGGRCQSLPEELLDEPPEPLEPLDDELGVEAALAVVDSLLEPLEDPLPDDELSELLLEPSDDELDDDAAAAVREDEPRLSVL